MIIALCSLSGAPGTTTLALALAGTWPTQSPVRVVEADASGGDIAAWWNLPLWPGVVDLAAASRSGQDHDTPPEEFSRFFQVLPGGLPVCVAPSTADRVGAALDLLARNPKALAGEGVTVVDLGRLYPETSAQELLAGADAVVVVTSGDVGHLKRLKDASHDLRERCARVGAVVVGPSRSAGEVSEAVGLPVWAMLPRDVVAAEVLTGRREQGRRLRRRPLIRQARYLGHLLAEQVHSASASAPDPAVTTFLGETP
ncbi:MULTISPECIES: P-loop NTPase family protein [Nocardiopsis]|uniref:Uncharacterized protein n=2 Tax=Nocardiopsis TaxID=2013 RepID=A0A840W8P0_9ACTN|nr:MULTISPECIES: hypothetical protein [Nocardiopsis]MBB5493420.1 hypothetical protein [Nocardiopsis metallicus]MCK9873036.1 hypothetical protein [Nocardiopsis dassonvillei]MEE2051632.1 hypothetical protein [Nocardiopsis umidischolae]